MFFFSNPSLKGAVRALANVKSPSKRARPHDVMPITKTEVELDREKRSKIDADAVNGLSIEAIFEEDDDVLEAESENIHSRFLENPDDYQNRRQKVPLVFRMSPPRSHMSMPLGGLQGPSPLQNRSKPQDGILKTYSKQKFGHNSGHGNSKSSMVQTSMNHFMYPRPPPSGTVGLRNLGNTCYMNSSLQALLVFDSLLKEVCNEETVRLAQATVSPGKVSLLCAFSRFWMSARSGGMILSPSNIKQLISESSSSRFGGNQQEDAHEFFSAMLNALEEAYEEATKKRHGPV